MNDRIKELAAQAGGEYPRGVYPNAILFYPAQLEKFAELVVRECADIAYNFGEPFEDGPGTKISDKIQEHFGIE